MDMHPPPPPPPPQAAPIPSPIHPPPVVSPTGPPNALLVELITFNGAPFKDHWAYWIHSPDSPDLGVQIHAAGDVYNGFKREARRSLDFRTATPVPTKRTPLQWVDGRFFDERAMLNAGSFCDHYAPVTHFEISAWMVKPPGKTLNAVDDTAPATSVGRKISQRNCQTWIIESAEQLVKDNILSREVADYLRAIEQ